ncbi:hypothetical protein CR513_17448, partial [Mucuna pruriens]
MLAHFCDANYVRDKLEMESTSRGCHFIGANLISWSSKRQGTIAMLLGTIHSSYELSKIPIYCDNTIAINLSKIPILHSKAKQGIVDSKFVSLEHIFRKPLPKDEIIHIRYFLGSKEYISDCHKFRLHHLMTGKAFNLSSLLVMYLRKNMKGRGKEKSQLRLPEIVAEDVKPEFAREACDIREAIFFEDGDSHDDSPLSSRLTKKKSKEMEGPLTLARSSKISSPPISSQARPNPRLRLYDSITRFKREALIQYLFLIIKPFDKLNGLLGTLLLASHANTKANTIDNSFKHY